MTRLRCAERAPDGKRAPRRVLGGIFALLLLAPGCGGGSSSNATTRLNRPDTVRKATKFRASVVAIPHAVFDPSAADEIARRAGYAAWVELNKERQNAHTLDLAVWPSRSAAKRALAHYRAGGPKTRSLVENTGWPHTLRQAERIRNVTLAWYHLPTLADERVVKGALRFSGGANRAHATMLWVIPGTLIDPDATAATGAARYSARLEAVEVPGRCLAGGCPGAVDGPVTVAIWPSEKAAKRHIQDLNYDSGSFHSKRIRNATLEVADFEGELTSADEAAVRNALH